MSKSNAALRAYVEKLLGLLRKQWPKTRCEVNHRNAYELMVGVILSAQSTDKAVNEITPGLFKRYPRPTVMAKAEPLDVEQIVHRTGFFRAKTKNILGACRRIVELHGGVVPKTMEELFELPGIGRKSANVILGAIHGIASGIVVDTHMIRLSGRLKLSKQEDPVKLEKELCAIVPEKDWIYFSQGMVLHGRYICIARQPRCWECYLAPICPYPDKTPPPEDDSKISSAPRKTITGMPIQIVRAGLRPGPFMK
jgi:endonuclease-3